MTTWLVHGFNVWDGGQDTVGEWAPYLPESRLFDYGWTFVFRLRSINDKAVDQLLELIEPGDVVVAHSNGCLIAWHLVQAGAPLAAVICAHPALRRDTPWPEDLPVLCLHSEQDRVVLLGRAWGRFVSVVNPLRERHGWGAAGHYGFDQKSVDNRKTYAGHSEVFPPRAGWGPRVTRWLDRKLKQRVV